AGGEANNIIADKAVLRGTIRTLNPEIRDLMETQVKQMSQSIAAVNQGSVEIRYTRGYPSIMNTPLETKRLTKVMQEKFGEAEVFEVESGMGGEDFAYYLQEKPGTFFYVGAKNAAIGANYPHHHPKFKIDETALLRSGEAFLAIAEDYLLKTAD
ncbi:MAG: M20/M25/M40 family metallo-hydrolase, partial [Carnobacterium sp.]